MKKKKKSVFFLLCQAAFQNHIKNFQYAKRNARYIISFTHRVMGLILLSFDIDIPGKILKLIKKMIFEQ